MYRKSWRTGKHVTAAVAVSVTALALTSCSGGSGFSDDSGGSGNEGSGPLEILIASSGDAETQSVKDAVIAWSEESGVDANVRAAADLPQQLSQGFAAGSPPDIFYVSDTRFVEYAANGSLLPYAGELDVADDFYPTLQQTFTYEDEFYCAPKDFSTLGLFINTEAWEAAGLTDADIPTTWEELKDVAGKLTTSDQAGLAFDPQWQRIGAFMAQAGGSLVNDDLTEATVDSPENLQALQYVQELLKSGDAQYSGSLGAGWGGEAFGKESAAMVIEGNWLIGAMSNDYPDVKYQVVQLPKGPGGPGTMQFTNCWGIASASDQQDDAISLVNYLVSADQQMQFAKDFGVMPSLKSVADEWKKEFPDQSAFLEGADYAVGVPPVPGISAVLGDFNAQLERLPNTDPATILKSVQSTLSAQISK